MRNKPIRGLYAVTPETSDDECLHTRVAAVLAGGARMIQYRSKRADSRRRRRQAGRLLELCRTHKALLIVNDDVDLAREIGADGVHLGHEDMSPASARAALGNGALIGVSCYDSLARGYAAQADGADYVAFGSFFRSAVKPDAVRAPLDLLRAASAVLELPIVAIGGITPENGGALIEAGADALAVISALFQVPDSCAAARALAALFQVQDVPLGVESDT
jgi:thiamine-phosphate pyrophosphorylase